VAEALGDENESLAWKIRDQYERDLIHLGWTLAQEGGQVPPTDANLVTLSTLNCTLEQQNHQLTSQLEALHCMNDRNII
jgi:hypothetical protein